MLCALIMAGGIGSRFWPQSTPEMPKQFLKLINDETMLQLTYQRINKLVPRERIFIVTNNEYYSLVKEQIKDISDTNIIKEPIGRSTAPCILLSSLYIKNIYGEARIVCISSDSYIAKEDLFIEKIKEADKFVEEHNEAFVTIGITPTRPETGYGYIKYLKDDNEIHKVLKFVEKPDYDRALKFLSSSDYLWNAGVYVFNNISMLQEMKEKIPIEYNLLKDLPLNNYQEFLKDIYHKCTKISVEYAISEKSNHIYTIISNIGWDDVGSWKSVERYIPKDNDDNTIKGNVITINSHGNIVYGNDKKIILHNIDDIFCIDSNNVIVIGKKDEIDKVHTLKDI